MGAIKYWSIAAVLSIAVLTLPLYYNISLLFCINLLSWSCLDFAMVFFSFLVDMIEYCLSFISAKVRPSGNCKSLSHAGVAWLMFRLWRSPCRDKLPPWLTFAAVACLVFIMLTLEGIDDCFFPEFKAFCYFTYIYWRETGRFNFSGKEVLSLSYVRF